MPSVVLVDTDGSLLVGSAAEAAAVRAPERVVREVARRLDDGTPIVVAGRSYSADGIAAEVVRWVADRVARHRGRPRSPHRHGRHRPGDRGRSRRGDRGRG